MICFAFSSSLWAECDMAATSMSRAKCGEWGGFIPFNGITSNSSPMATPHQLYNRSLNLEFGDEHDLGSYRSRLYQ
jgi:hypothetical protein